MVKINRENEKNLEEIILKNFRLGEDGELYRFDLNIKKWREQNTSDPKSQRYIRVKIARKKIPLHRLVWFLYYGRWPENEIDHVDRNKSNNNIKNLREATRSENMLNRYNSQIGKGASKFIGVNYYKSRDNWVSEIWIKKQKKFFGYFNTEEEAAKVRDQYIIDNNLLDRYKLNFPSLVTNIVLIDYHIY